MNASRRRVRCLKGSRVCILATLDADTVTAHRTPGAHAVTIKSLLAVARVWGVVLVVWATAAGGYIFLGGIARLTNPVFRPVVQAFGGYQVVGGVLSVGGILGLAGYIFKARWLSIMSCIICAGWNGALAVLLFIAAIHGFDNIAAWFAVPLCIAYVLRFILLVEVPG